LDPVWIWLVVVEMSPVFSQGRSMMESIPCL